jgi:hypothetical protein
MAEEANQKLDQLYDEIQSIKGVIRQKKSTLHQVLHPRHLRLPMLFIGIGISLFSLVYYFLMLKYVNFSNVPPQTRQIYNISMSLTVVALFSFFCVFWARSKVNNKIKGGGDVLDVLDSLFSFRIFNLMFPVRILGFYFVITFIEKDMLYFIVPTLSIVVGLHANFLGCITETRNYVIWGYWYLGAALITLIYANSIPTPLAVFFSLGCGSLLLGLLPNSKA